MPSNTTPGPDYPHHQNADALVVTRGDEVVRTLDCERVVLDGQGRWHNGHIDLNPRYHW